MLRFIPRRIVVGLFCIIIGSGYYNAAVRAANDSEAGPCQGSISDLKASYEGNPEFKKLLTSALANMQHLPAEYPADNPWLGATFTDLTDFFADQVRLGNQIGLFDTKSD